MYIKKMNALKSTVISKETINRLIKDVRQMIKNPLTDNGIYYIHDDEDMLKGYAMIVGPEDTPYFGGYYFFEFHFTSDYPYSPPKVVFYTNNGSVRFNPNLYVNGKVCLSLLNTWKGESWSSCQTISSILLVLCTTLCKNPMLNEPGITIKHVECSTYNSIIEYSNLNIAMCDMINKKTGIFPMQFVAFYPYMLEHFRKNYDIILKFVESKIKDAFVLETRIYNMKELIDYNSLHAKLIKLEKV